MLLNAQAVKDLNDMVGAEAVAEIAAALKESLADFTNTFASAAEADLAGIAHTLKGATGYLGTEDLHNAFVEADHIAKDGGDVRSALQQAADLIPSSLEALEQTLKELGL